MDMKVVQAIQEVPENKDPQAHLDLLVFLDQLEKKEEMPRNSLAAPDLRDHVVHLAQLDPLVPLVLMLLLENLVHKDLKVALELQDLKEIKDQKVMLEVMVDQVAMQTIVLAQPVTLMPIVVLVDLVTMVVHTVVFKKDLVHINGCTYFFCT
jgi:hypothetical protein